MPSLQSHLTVLQATADRFPSRPVYKVAHLNGDEIEHWTPITYRQFLNDIDLSARRWTRVLRQLRVPPRSVIGLWLGGLNYTDATTIYGLTRAGYIPQMFSLRLPDPTIVIELLQRATAQAIFYDTAYAPDLAASGCPLPTLTIADLLVSDITNEPLPAMPSSETGEETVFIFHTSGSTSGSPKLIPCSFKWLDAMVTKGYNCVIPRRPDVQDVNVWMGSMCHIGQNFMFWGAMQHGTCTIIPTRIDFNSPELVNMVHHGGLNRINAFPPFLCTHLRNARQDPKLLAILKGLDDILYSGLELPQETDDWCRANGLKLTNTYGSTEVGAMMLSNHDPLPNGRFLRPMEGTQYGFFPASSEPETESGHVDVHSRLLECVILSSSPDCPDKSLRAADGHYHTGDLFAEVAPGAYVFRGRNDDWIKSENSLRVDTKSIEDNVRTTCNGLISDCIVVGMGRPCPALFVEPAVDIDHAKLKKEILRRIKPFHTRRYLHERITSTNCIVVVPADTLPRTSTKGNIRRKAVEEQFRAVLDEMHGRPAI